MTSQEFRKRAEALARGERPKAKAATPRPKATLRPKPKPAYTPRTWGEALAHIVKRDHVGMAEAGKRAAREYPSLHPARRAQ